jgi:hypothetical protein
MGKKKKSNRTHGMSWDEILEYEIIIKKIASKYSGDPSLAEDVVQEVILKLHTDINLDTSKFDPKKKDAAIRNTIRNKVIKVLKSKKIGRWQFESTEQLSGLGMQISSTGKAIFPKPQHKLDEEGTTKNRLEDYNEDAE